MNLTVDLLLGFTCIVGAAAAWYCRLSYNNADNAYNAYNAHNNEDNNDNRKKVRKSKPGDLCLICLKEMTISSMHKMQCGHALCQPCYKIYRTLRRECPYCEKLVIRINEAGEDCCICYEPMTTSNIKYLKCEHALHTNCLLACIDNNINKCPICCRDM